MSHPEIVQNDRNGSLAKGDGRDRPDRRHRRSTWSPNGPVPPKIPDRVPDMMFEIVSPDKASRDRDIPSKRAEYHRFGVKEYVIVDRFKTGPC